MAKKKNQLSSPSSTGGLGNDFENRIQASFILLMLTESFAPCLPQWPIKKIKLQGEYQGYKTDDIIVFTQLDKNKEAKLIGQIKLKIRITNSDEEFKKVIKAAWNDFNNGKFFSEENDIIALICGPLSAADTDGVRGLIKQAGASESSDDFIKRIKLAKFTGQSQRNKLIVFKNALKIANNNVALTKDQLWRFLKRYRLLIYDLDMKGVTLSLIHSLIGQYPKTNVNALWAQLYEFNGWKNEKAGTITIDSIPKEIKESFTKQLTEIIPGSLTKEFQETDEEDWSKSQYASDLVIANLLGSWNENLDADKKVIEQIAQKDFAIWIDRIREVLQLSNSPISHKNGVWTINDRQKLWDLLSSRVFDKDLDLFKECAISFLKEPDPQFELKSDERFAASIHGKVLKNSQYIRTGVAETLALIGSNVSVLENCSSGKPEMVVFSVVREILQDADWILWSSLNPVLPLLSEASPNAFLDAVEITMSLKPCPFDELFLQEGDGITGINYLTGLLWALETLAWDEQYLARVVVILGDLSTHDPGGNWANRPSNSLSTIFLPWLPQTMASIEKRKVAVKTLQKENEDEAWKLILKLLPNQHQISSGSSKPRWRKWIPDDWDKTVSHKDYWEQISFYTEMAVEIAKNDIAKLNILIDHLDNLTGDSFKKMLEHLSSPEIVNKPEEERVNIWETLVSFISKHRKYADAKWAMGSEVVSKIENVAVKLAPKNPLFLYHRLFSEPDHELIDEKGKFQEQQEELEKYRRAAIKEIYDFGGISTVISFIEMVKFPEIVGNSLGAIAEIKEDLAFLPEFLKEDNKKHLQFVRGFIFSRYQNKGGGWIDKLNRGSWSFIQTGIFLTCLLFTMETWKRAKKYLGEHESEYWKRVQFYPFLEKDDLYYAIDKLVKYDRPYLAISCLSRLVHKNQPLNKKKAINTLRAAVSYKETFSMRTYDIVEIIKALQDAPDTNLEDLSDIEWAYLPLLDSYRGTSPKTLGMRLASDYKFFCEVIRFVYRSNKKVKEDMKPTEQQQAIAKNAYHLLREWKTLPGLQSDGSFDGDYFKKWLNLTKKECIKTGHLGVALRSMGHMLIHTPPDPDGLWINKIVAEELNSKDAEGMRNGYRTAIFNSRGAYTVDPSGKPELELSVKYEKQANEVEDKGYHRFAATLRLLVDSYKRDAERIINEFGNKVKE